MSSIAPPKLANEPPPKPERHRRLLRPFRLPGGWRNAAREFVVIVAGVLAALAAQAWWEDRQERSREEEYLHQLVADTRENEQRLTASIEEDSVSAEATARLMVALDPAAPAPRLTRYSPG